MSARRLVATCIFVALAVPAAAHDGHHATDAERYMRSVETYALPDEKMVDMNGAVLALGESLASEEPLMMNFVFTSCTATCPVMSATFAQVQARLDPERDKLRFISISIDPEHDTPSRLRQYARKFGAGPHWQFLTSSADASIAVQRAFDVYRGDKMSHEPVTFLRAAPGKPWIRLEGFARASDLIREYRRLLN